VREGAAGGDCGNGGASYPADPASAPVTPVRRQGGGSPLAAHNLHQHGDRLPVEDLHVQVDAGWRPTRTMGQGLATLEPLRMRLPCLSPITTTRSSLSHLPVGAGAARTSHPLSQGRTRAVHGACGVRGADGPGADHASVALPEEERPGPRPRVRFADTVAVVLPSAGWAGDDVSVSFSAQAGIGALRGAQSQLEPIGTLSGLHVSLVNFGDVTGTASEVGVTMVLCSVCQCAVRPHDLSTALRLNAMRWLCYLHAGHSGCHHQCPGPKLHTR
jgi:hypothetical protein